MGDDTNMTKMKKNVTLYNRLLPFLEELSKHVSQSDIEWQNHCENVMNKLLGDSISRESSKKSNKRRIP